MVNIIMKKQTTDCIRAFIFPLFLAANATPFKAQRVRKALIASSLYNKIKTKIRGIDITPCVKVKNTEI